MSPFDFDADFAPLTLGKAYRTAWPAELRVLGPAQAGDLALISGGDGCGKSWVAMTAALSVAKGRALLGGMWDVPAGAGGPALYIAVEDRTRDHGARLQKIVREAMHLREIGAPPADDDADLVVWPLHGKRMSLVTPTPNGPSRYGVTEAGERFAQSVAGYRLVVIDPLRAFHDLDEGDGAGLDFLARWLVSVAMRNEQVILAVHQASQGAILAARDDHHAGRGATDFPAACRAVWTLRGMTPDEADKAGIDQARRRAWRALVNGKASHADEAAVAHLEKTAEGVFVRKALPATPSTPTRRGKARPDAGAAAYRSAAMTTMGDEGNSRDVW